MSTHTVQRNEHRHTAPGKLSSVTVITVIESAKAGEAALLAALDVGSAIADQCEVRVGVRPNSAQARTAHAVGGLFDAIRVCEDEDAVRPLDAIRLASTAPAEWLLFVGAGRQLDRSELAQLVRLSDGRDIVVGRRRRVGGRLLAARAAGVAEINPGVVLLRTRAVRRLLTDGDAAYGSVTDLLAAATHRGFAVASAPAPASARRRDGGRDGRMAASTAVALRCRYEPAAERQQRQLRRHTWAVTALALLTGVVATAWVAAHHATMAYSDAESHVNVAKRVVSGLVPGASQLGGGWLPLQHLLMLPFVTSDSLWRTGLAGAVVSVPALALLAAAMYRLAHQLTGARWASWLAPLVVLANLNALYLAATPMPDILAMALAAASVCCLARWVLRAGLPSLLLAALFAALATLTRYDSWVLVALEGIVVLGVGGRRLRGRQGLDGIAMVFGCVAFFGVACWVTWNQLIFSNAGYFAFGQGSSWWGLRPLVDQGQLPTYLHFGLSVGYYLTDTVLVAGGAVVAAAAIGAILAVRHAVRAGEGARLAVLIVCLFPLVAYPLGLWAGFARLAVPTNGSHDWSQLANARFGVAMLLPLGILVAVLAARHRFLVPALVAVVAISGAVQGWTSSVVSYQDAWHGHASRAVALGPDAPAAQEWLAEHYTGGRVLMDTAHPAVSLTATGLSMRAFIQGGDAPYWAESMDQPARWARWVVLREEPQDALWTGLTDVGRAALADEFVEVYRSGGVHVLERRPSAPGMVRQRGTHLYLAGARFRPVGVNSYDLLQLPTHAARARLGQLHGSGFNVVRVWCFDHDGGLSPETLQRLDAVVANAHRLGLRLICTLGNARSEYGGPRYFTPAGQDFFTSDSAMSAYQAQVQLLLDHEDAAGNRLADSPTILAWDLLNEPRLVAGEPRDAVTAWTEQMARFVNSLDQNHLITIGGEGFTAHYPANRTLASLPGTGFRDLCGVPGITLCSAHLYPKYLTDPTNAHAVAAVMTGWRDTADSLRRPVVVEEVGYPLPGHSTAERLAFLRSVGQQVVRADLDGGLLWNVGANRDQGYRLSYSSPQERQVLNGWARWLTPQN